MTFYRKKPIVVDAIQLSWKTLSEVHAFLIQHGLKKDELVTIIIPTDEVSYNCNEEGPGYLSVEVTTIHGDTAYVRHGDWVISDSKPGTFYPCKPDVFETTYEPLHNLK